MTDKEVAIAVPTAFPELFKDAWKHDDARGPGGRIGLYCTKCKVEYTRENDELGKPCTVPTPIVIDWNTAHKVVAEVSPLEFMRAMVTVYIDKTGIKKPTSWEVQVYLVKPECTPADYLRAALEAVKGVE